MNYVGFNIIGKNNETPIGTRVHIVADGQYQMQEFNLSRGYLSSVSPRIHFGLGTSTQIDQVTVEWPDGKTSELKGIQLNNYTTIDYNKQTTFVEKDEGINSDEKTFETVVQEAPFLHKENPYDDFKEEIFIAS